ncbi:hypothetical protein CYMTET_51391 [Cymbomonas tetramitiformis]|uniref:C2 domain-containing protein n=1 Tax=Cymbomonas tetramitiformis TaxID=36881 RepID=A0AAE0ETR2_9CHLO|nr:hypothetical protein CYMTET_51391 [Cymbomonas tetramitiformis]
MTSIIKKAEGMKAPIGILEVSLNHGSGLVALDVTGSSDPYVKFGLKYHNRSDLPPQSAGKGAATPGGAMDKESIKTSKVINRTLTPVWNEKFLMNVYGKSAYLRLDVLDKDYATGDDWMGECEISLDRFFSGASGKSHTNDFSLSPNQKIAKDRKVTGFINLTLSYEKVQRAEMLITVDEAKDLKEKATSVSAVVGWEGELIQMKTVKSNKGSAVWGEDVMFSIDQKRMEHKTLSIDVLGKGTALVSPSNTSFGSASIPAGALLTAYVQALKNGNRNPPIAQEWYPLLGRSGKKHGQVLVTISFNLLDLELERESPAPDTTGSPYGSPTSPPSTPQHQPAISQAVSPQSVVSPQSSNGSAKKERKKDRESRGKTAAAQQDDEAFASAAAAAAQKAALDAAVAAGARVAAEHENAMKVKQAEFMRRQQQQQQQQQQPQQAQAQTSVRQNKSTVQSAHATLRSTVVSKRGVPTEAPTDYGTWPMAVAWMCVLLLAPPLIAGLMTMIEGLISTLIGAVLLFVAQISTLLSSIASAVVSTIDAFAMSMTMRKAESFQSAPSYAAPTATPPPIQEAPRVDEKPDCAAELMALSKELTTCEGYAQLQIERDTLKLRNLNMQLDINELTMQLKNQNSDEVCAAPQMLESEDPFCLKMMAPFLDNMNAVTFFMGIVLGVGLGYVFSAMYRKHTADMLSKTTLNLKLVEEVLERKDVELQETEKYLRQTRKELLESRGALRSCNAFPLLGA